MKQFPYFYNSTGKSFNKKRASYLQNVLYGKLKKQHKRGTTSLSQQKHKQHISQFSFLGKKYKYAMKLDIKKYYLNIDHNILEVVLTKLYQKFVKQDISRYFNQFIDIELPKLLKQSPYKNVGIPIGSWLSTILSEIYLFSLDYKLESHKIPYLRRCDDIIIFYNNEGGDKQILQTIINPQLQKLGLSLNPNKSLIVKTHNTSISYIGYTYKSGYLGIANVKVKEFKDKISKLTDLRVKIRVGKLILKINRLIYGRGHYYKYADCKQLYSRLDGYIRNKLRRKLTGTKSYQDNIGNNLSLSNNYLNDELGLVSLEGIKTKYGSKKKHKKSKKEKTQSSNSIKKSDTGRVYTNYMLWRKMESIERNIKKLVSQLGV